MRFFSLFFFLLPYFLYSQISFDNFGSTIYGTESLGNSNPNDNYIDSLGNVVAISGDGNTIVVSNERIKYSASNLGTLNGQTLWGTVTSAFWPRITAYKYVDSTNSWVQKGNPLIRYDAIVDIDISENGNKIIFREIYTGVRTFTFDGANWNISEVFPNTGMYVHSSADGNSYAFVNQNNIKIGVKEFLPPYNWVFPTIYYIDSIIDVDFEGSNLSDGWISSICVVSSKDDTVRILDSKMEEINGYENSIVDVLYDNDSLAQFGTKVSMSENGNYIAVLSTSSISSKRKVDLFQFQENSPNDHYIKISTLENLADNPKDIALSKDAKVLTLSYPDFPMVQSFYVENNMFYFRQTNQPASSSDIYGFDIDINDIGSRIVTGVKQEYGFGYVEVNGCRHIDTIIDSINVCSSYTWIDGNNYNTSNNTATHITSSINGCEQLHKLDLTISQTFNNISNFQSICNGDSLFAGGEFQYSDGIFIDTLMNSAGNCEVITTTLSLQKDTNIVINTCSGDSLFVGGSFQTSSGVYVDTLVSTIGCDSLVTTTLFTGVLQNVRAWNSYHYSSGYNGDFFGIDGDFYDANTSLFMQGSPISIYVNGIFYNYLINFVTTPSDNQTGVEHDNVRYVFLINYDGSPVSGNADGWNITINDTYIVNSISSYTDTQFTSCDFTWIDGITYSNSNNSATFTLPNSNIYGCDSIVNLNLTIEPIYASIEQNGNNLEVSNIENATSPYYFEWSSGDTTRVITPDSNTLYWAILQDADSCFSDTLSFEVTFMGGMDLSLVKEAVKVYPNPTENIIIITIDNYHGPLEIQLYELSGKLLKTTTTNVLNLFHIQSGTYFLKVVYGDKVKQLKIVRK
tara:strand:- start:536 stop:3100 length:2565 start_codon:yes stop_codon:yes gene_type:complete